MHEEVVDNPEHDGLRVKGKFKIRSSLVEKYIYLITYLTIYSMATMIEYIHHSI